MKRVIFLLIFLPWLILPVSCHKIKAGLQTTVHGYISDPTTHLPVSFAKIIIGEFINRRSFLGSGDLLVFNQFLDSTLSNAEGNYTVQFKSTGQGTNYAVLYFPPENYFINSNAIFLEAGKDTSLNFSMTKAHVLKAIVQVNGNPYPPLTIVDNPIYFAKYDPSNVYKPPLYTNYIQGEFNQDTIFFKVMPEAINSFTFSTTPDSSFTGILRYHSDLYLRGLADTFYHSFLISKDSLQ